MNWFLLNHIRFQSLPLQKNCKGSIIHTFLLPSPFTLQAATFCTSQLRYCNNPSNSLHEISLLPTTLYH